VQLHAFTAGTRKFQLIADPDAGSSESARYETDVERINNEPTSSRIARIGIRTHNTAAYSRVCEGCAEFCTRGSVGLGRENRYVPPASLLLCSRAVPELRPLSIPACLKRTPCPPLLSYFRLFLPLSSFIIILASSTRPLETCYTCCRPVWLSSSDRHVCSRSVPFRSWLHNGAILTEDSSGSPESCQANDETEPRLGQDHFLPDPFQFIIHLVLDTDSVVNHRTN
jgi:hypothetical protein